MILDVVSLIFAFALFCPALVLLLESLAAMPGAREIRAASVVPLRFAILVPAHNEGAGIGATLDSILPQLGPEDRLVVIADNCTDQTAEVARSAGALVVERTDPIRRGKGYALDFGLRSLEADPPHAVVIFDADCVAAAASIANLATEAVHSNRPVQAAYLLEVPRNAGTGVRISAFAFRFKNFIRPLGLARLGCPCLLTGTGMAFPWAIISTASLASGNIVEDMQLGIDLACRGFAPRFCPGAKVTGVLPTQARAQITQRTRWEHGHIRTLLTQTPRLLFSAVRRRRIELLALALELSVPPLSLLILLYLLALAGTFLVGATVFLQIVAIALALVASSLLLGWVRFGRDLLSPWDIARFPLYVIQKISIYLAFIFRPQRQWIRTARENAASEK